MGKSDFKSYSGFYRAKVTWNKDPEKYGRIKVWIPDLMPLIDAHDPNLHLWARAANNPIGGRNNEEREDQYFQGSCYIPPIGSWVWIFFENDNPNRPYYWGSLDIENSPVLAENQYGEEYQKKWTVIKTHEGRCIITSDDPNDSRLELTGKKREIKNQPSGDTTSVYKLLDNQTSILFDEREGKEKLLIKTYKGDYLNFDIETRKLHIYTADDIHFKTDKSIYMEAGKDIHITSGSNTYLKSGAATHIKAGATVNIDGSDTYIQSGTAVAATKSDPIGLRDQIITECALVVSLTDVSDMGAIGEELIELSDSWSGLSDEYLSHMEQVHDFILGAAQSLHDLNPNLGQHMLDAATPAGTLAEESGSLVENVTSSISSNVQAMKDKIEDAQDSVFNIHKAFDQRDPNTLAAYEELKAAKEQLMGLSDIVAKHDSLDGSLGGLYEQMKITTDAINPGNITAIAQAALDAENALLEYQASISEIIDSFSAQADAYAASGSAIQESVEEFLGANTAVDELHQIGEAALANISEELYLTDQSAATTVALETNMIGCFDNWDLAETQMQSQLSDSYEILGFNDMSANFDTIKDGLYTYTYPAIQECVDTSDNISGVISNASDMGAVGTEIANLTDEISSTVGSVDMSSLDETVTELSSLLPGDVAASVASSLSELNNTISEINSLSYTLTGNSISILDQSTNLINNASNVANAVSTGIMLTSASSMKNTILHPGESLMKISNSLQGQSYSLSEQQKLLEIQLKEKRDNDLGIVWSPAYREQVYSQAEIIDPDSYQQAETSIQDQRNTIIADRIENMEPGSSQTSCLDLLDEASTLSSDKVDWLYKCMEESDFEIARLNLVAQEDNASWSPAWREEMYRHRVPINGDPDYPPPFPQEDRLQELQQLINRCA